MEYIVHKHFKGTAANGKRMNLHYGETYPQVGPFIATKTDPPEAIFNIASDNAHQFMSRNDDGRGLERGALTYAIAWAKREQINKAGQLRRFNDEEVELLETKYGRFLKEDCPTLIFNHDFFNAEVEELEEVAKDLHIKIKK